MKFCSDSLILLGIALAVGISLLNFSAYAPALNIYDALDDILRLLLVLGLLSFLIKKIQTRWHWSNRLCLTILGVLIFGGIVLARPDALYWFIFIKSVSILAITVCSLWSIGNAVLRWGRIAPQSITGYDWLACSIGAVLLSALLFWIGWGVGVTDWSVIGIVVLGIGLSLNKSTLSSLRERLCQKNFTPWSGWEWLGMLCFIRIGLTLVVVRGGNGAFSPVTGFDATWYRVFTPKMWLEQGAIGFFYPTGRDFSPGLVESFFLVGLAFQSEIAAKAMHALLAMLGAGACWVLGNELANRKVALLAALLYLLVPEFLHFSRFGYVDAAGAGFLVHAVLGVLVFFRTQKLAWLGIVGLLCGGLAAFRYQGLLFALIVAVVLGGCLLWQRYSFQQWAKAALLVALLTFLTGGGWYVRNWVDLGNPVYPFAHSVFQGHYFAWEEKDRDILLQSAASFGYPPNLTNFLLSPLRFYLASKKLDHNPDTTHGIIPILGWLAMCFGLFWKNTRFVAVVFGLCWIAWFTSSQISRYSLPFMALGAVLGAILVAKIQPQKWRYGVAILLVLLMLSVNKKTLKAQPYPILLPAERLEHLRKRIRYFPLIEYLQKHVDPDSCLYTITAWAWFHFPNHCLYSQDMGHRYRFFAKYPLRLFPKNQLLPLLCELQIDYLLINDIPPGSPLPPPWPPEQNTNLYDPEYAGLFELLAQHNQAVLYHFARRQHCA